MKTNFKLVLLAFFTFVSCASDELDLDQSLEQCYARAIVDASAVLTQDDIYDGLVPIVYGESDLLNWRIVGTDTMVLVSSVQSPDWMGSAYSENQVFESSERLDDIIWVTIPEQMDEYLAKDLEIADSTSLNIRLLQILGLKPDEDASMVYIFWVNKNDLLRPSYVNDVTTTHGAIEFAENTEPEWYEQWFKYNVKYSYDDPTEGLNYPFSRLGYTYDWGSESKYGPSEYIILPSSKLIMNLSMDCWSYYNMIRVAETTTLFLK